MAKKLQEYTTYLSPEFIYIPFDDINKLKINKDKMVYFNSCLGENNDESKIFSPVSGRIIGTKEMTFLNKKSNTLVIENDFIDKREKLNPLINISKVKKSEVSSLLSKYGLNKKINSKTTLVVNSYYDKKYDLKDVVINHESYEEILEAIDEFLDIFNMKTCYIYIDKNDLYSINAYEKYINAFLNICIVHSNRKFKESNCVFYNVEEILAIHKAIHLDYMYDNTIITIYTDKPNIIKVKVNSSLVELLKVMKIQYMNSKIIINNKEVSSIDDFIIDSSIRSIIVR